MTMHKTLYPSDGIDQLYVSRKRGGRRLSNILDCVDVSIQGHKNYIKNRKEW